MPRYAHHQTSCSLGRLTSDSGCRQGTTRQHVGWLLRTSPNKTTTLELNEDSRPTLAVAQQGLEAIYRRGYRFMKGGVMLLDLVDANREQLSLLDTPEREAQRERDHKLMATLDELNGKMGKGTVRLGLPWQNAAWHLRCAHRTPRWTTQWRELKSVKAY